MTDAKVVHAAAFGDDAALDLLLRTYHQRLHRFATRVCLDDFDADDAVQEAFIKLAKRPDVIGDPRSLSWLFAVVRNACHRLLRPFARQRARLGEPVQEAGRVAADTLSPEAALERFQVVQSVHSAVSRLEPAYREVLVLRDLEGLSGDEVCAALQIGQAAMKSRLHRAREEVRRVLIAAGHAPTRLPR